MAKELNFESLLSELEGNISTITKGDYIFSELTMKEQRRILNMGFSPIEIPVRISNLYNDFISESVTLKDDIIGALETITMDVKPYVMVQLRKITLGDFYVDSSGKKYRIREVIDSDLKSKIEPKMIEFNNFILRLSVPNLVKDRIINGQLLVELGNFKKNLSDEDYGKVADLYNVYELFKYITEIELNGDIFDFEKCPVNKKMKIVNNLPQRVIYEINDYIDSVKQHEEKALEAINDETGETTTMDMTTLFFTKHAKNTDE
jgi:hypothetical protein